MIPGGVINALTFPGVVIHEWSHAKACNWRGVPVYEIGYLDDDMGGHVTHEQPRSFGDTLAITMAPFLGNTVVAVGLWTVALATIAAVEWVGRGAPAVLYLVVYGAFLLVVWLAISAGWHAIPSSGDAGQLLAWRKRKPGWRSTLTVLAVSPLILLLYVANLLRFFWLDAVYSLGLAYLTWLAMDAAIGVG